MFILSSRDRSLANCLQTASHLFDPLIAHLMAIFFSLVLFIIFGCKVALFSDTK